jgi:hypothetical protein
VSALIPMQWGRFMHAAITDLKFDSNTSLLCLHLCPYSWMQETEKVCKAHRAFCKAKQPQLILQSIVALGLCGRACYEVCMAPNLIPLPPAWISSALPRQYVVQATTVLRPQDSAFKFRHSCRSIGHLWQRSKLSGSRRLVPMERIGKSSLVMFRQ